MVARLIPAIAKSMIAMAFTSASTNGSICCCVSSTVVAGTVVVLPEVGGSVTGSVVGCSVCTELEEDVDGLLGTV